jgi:hypothetical protein
MLLILAATKATATASGCLSPPTSRRQQPFRPPTRTTTIEPTPSSQLPDGKAGGIRFDAWVRYLKGGRSRWTVGLQLDSELCACRIDRPAGHTDGLTTCLHALITFGWPVLLWVRAV